MAPRKTVGSREAAAAVALARSSASSHCSVVCSSTVDPRRRWKTVITRGHKRSRARMGDRLQVKQDRHKWTNEETNHFLEVAMDLAENGEFKKHKYRRCAFRKIHSQMAEKGSCNVSYENVRFKFYTYLDIWNRYNNLKCEKGSCFNPVTGTFDAPKEWWTSLHQTKKDKYMMFRKCIPYMEKLDIIFSHMEDPPKEIVWKFVSNGSSIRSTTGDWGYERTESLTVQQGSSSRVTQTNKLLDELLESGVQELDDDYINAINLLRDPLILERYSKLSSVENKIAFLRKLQARGVQVANRSHGQQ